MRDKKYIRPAAVLLLLGALFAVPFSFHAEPLAAVQQPNIGVNGFFSADRAQLGRTTSAAIVINIPSGYHINSNRPLAKFLIPTSVKIEAPRGIRASAVSYPRAQLRSFSFSQDKLSVYEGSAVLRFNITIPPNFATGVMELRAHVKFQSCNDEACFAPQTRQIAMPIAVVGANEPVKRINGNIFGGGRRQ